MKSVQTRYQAEGDKFLHRFVICDETWVYHYIPATKREKGRGENMEKLNRSKKKRVSPPVRFFPRCFGTCAGFCYWIFFTTERQLMRPIIVNFWTGQRLLIVPKIETDELGASCCLLHIPHTSAVTCEKLIAIFWNDCYLFGALKKGRQRFEGNLAVEEYVLTWLQIRPQTFFDTGKTVLPTLVN